MPSSLKPNNSSLVCHFLRSACWLAEILFKPNFSKPYSINKAALSNAEIPLSLGSIELSLTIAQSADFF